MITIIVAVVLYITVIPIIDLLQLHLGAINPDAIDSIPHFEQRIDYGVSLIILLPLLTIAVAGIYFIMRAIKRQGYSRYEDELN